MTHPLSEAGTSVEVKPLEWKTYGDFEHSAKALGGHYIIMRRAPASGERFILHTMGRDLKADCGTLDEAKALAQADYEQRIRRALIQPTPAETEGEESELVGTLRGVAENATKRLADMHWKPSRANIETMRNLLETSASSLESSGAEVASLRAALTEISSPTQTTNLLWWQIKAREALRSPTPPPIGDGEGDLVALIEDLRAAAMFWETGGVEKERTLEWKAATAIESLSRQLEEARDATETERFPKTLGLIHAALDGYVSALVDREHGGIAMSRAFEKICEALGRHPTQEMDARRAKETVSHG